MISFPIAFVGCVVRGWVWTPWVFCVVFFWLFSVVLFAVRFLLCAVFAFDFLALDRYFVCCPVLFRGFVLLCFASILVCVVFGGRCLYFELVFFCCSQWVLVLGFLVSWVSLVLLIFGLVLVFPVVPVLYFQWVYLEIQGFFVVLQILCSTLRDVSMFLRVPGFAVSGGHKHGAHFSGGFCSSRRRSIAMRFS